MPNQTFDDWYSRLASFTSRKQCTPDDFGVLDSTIREWYNDGVSIRAAAERLIDVACGKPEAMDQWMDPALLKFMKHGTFGPKTTTKNG